ncbi:MAG: TrmO family methyltransferase [Candidatus Deferrimicrobiaceae bacterium]
MALQLSFFFIAHLPSRSRDCHAKPEVHLHDIYNHRYSQPGTDRTRDRPQRGVFATRSPHRPNPVSLHTVELPEGRENVLRIRGMDATDVTPFPEIKPHARERGG